MIVNLADFAGRDILDISFHSNLEQQNNVDLADGLVNFNFKGVMKKDGFRYILNGHAEVKAKLLCNKCLEPVDILLDFDVDEIYSREYDVSNDEVWWFEGDKIGLGPVLMANFYMNKPMKVMCKEECAGICPTCGKNLNEGDCGCDNTPRDPRFEVLRSLFKREEV